MTERPYYTRALNALNAAHHACYKAWQSDPNHNPIGMSVLPWGGVSEALGIVDELERRLAQAEQAKAALMPAMQTPQDEVGKSLEG